MTQEMPSEAAIKKCRELGLDERWAPALDAMWNETDANILQWLEIQSSGCGWPADPPSAPFDGSLKHRRYWKKAKFSDE